MQIVFAIGVAFLVFGLPESPRWLYSHDRPEEAVQVLCTVYDKLETDDLIVKESTQIKEAIELEERNGSFQWRHILRKDSVQTGRRVLLAWGVQFMNQAGGINLVVYYIPCEHSRFPALCLTTANIRQRSSFRTSG
jgi:hypothetical protein